LWNSNNLDNLFDKAEFRRLRHVSVNSPYVTDHTLNLLTQFVELETLELEASCVTEMGVGRLVDLPNLHTLKLSSCQTITNLEAVAQLSALKVLDLTDCEMVTDWNCVGLLHNLRKLDLSLTGITDFDLSGLCTMTALRHLNLFGCQSLTDACMESLVKFPNLRHVNLHCCYRVSKDMLATCKAKFPCSQDRFAA
jgi:hypothetical protein